MPVTSQFSMMSTPSASARARVAPGDGVVPRRAAARCSAAPSDRVTDVRLDVERRAERLRLLRRQPLVVDAVAAVGVDVRFETCTSCTVVREHHARRAAST
jgi:hypothetical protein